MTTPRAVVHGSAELLAAAAATRLVITLLDAQAARGSAAIVLTGGGIGTAVLKQLRTAPARDAVDWSHVDVYWGDERFLPHAHPERNETQAREALLDHVPVDPRRVHPIAAAGSGPDEDPETAATAYTRVLAATARPDDHGAVPAFDVCLLGVGEEGHTASVFPSSPAVYETAAPVVAVRDCPKPPPTRISLTLPAIRCSHEVWLLAAGERKAGAVAMALGGAGESQIPAAGARGLRRTRWLLDKAAASTLPSAFLSPTG